MTSNRMMQRTQRGGRILQLLCVVAGGMAWVRDASAYCRAKSQAPPANFDQAASCFEGSPPGEAKSLYWLNSCVGYSLQQDASTEISLEQITRAAASAFATWAAVDCGGGAHPSIDATHDMGPVSCDKVEYNSAQPNQHVILLRDGVWPYPGAVNTLALTTLRFDDNGELFDADMEINAPAVALAAQDRGRDIALVAQSILLHEAGHYLGLAHSTNAQAVMYAYYPPESLTLTQDDVDGVCAIYPPDGSRVTSAGQVGAAACDPTPRHGFSAQCGVPGADVVGNDAPKEGGCDVSGGPLPGRGSSGSRSAFLTMGVTFGLAMREWTRRRGSRVRCARASALLSGVRT